MSTLTVQATRPSLLIVRPAAWRQLGHDLAYVLPGFFVSLASFIALITLFSTGVSTLVIWVGLPILVACLATAKAFATVDRAALKRWAGSIPPVYYKPRQNNSITGMIKSLSDPQLWRDLLHGGLIAFAFRMASFSTVITWLATALGGLTYWFWSIFLPEDNTGVTALIGLDKALNMSPELTENLFSLLYGLIFLFTLPPVIHLLAVADAAIAKSLLTNENAALRARSQELHSRREQVVSEGASMLRKIERDLHDGPQQRLIRLQMDMEAAKRRMETDPEAAQSLLDGALEQSREALAELRALSRGIAPPILADRGLTAALTSLSGRASVPVTFTSDLKETQRLPENAENAAYFVASEALANVSKHSEAQTATLEIAATEELLTITVHDDGRGGAHLGKGHGLAGLADRLAGVDGSLEVRSPAGGPTQITATIPLGALTRVNQATTNSN